MKLRRNKDKEEKEILQIGIILTIAYGWLLYLCYRADIFITGILMITCILLFAGVMTYFRFKEIPNDD